MKKSIKLWELFGFAFATLAGTLLHFLYDFSGKAIWAATISGVNESTWEHMKLLFFPMLLFAVIQSFFFRDNISFWCIKLKGILLGLSLIPFLFYMYNGIIGKSGDFINILIFFISAAGAHIFEARQFINQKTKCRSSKFALITVLVIVAMFVVFTFITPRLAIFMDPITGTYGIPNS